jgi:DnaJ domain
MAALIAGLVVLYVLMFGAKQFARLSPAAAVRLVRQAGQALAILFALFLLMRGNIILAAVLGSAALGYTSWQSIPGFGAFFRGNGTGGGKGQNSRVRSAMIEMQLDHVSGQMSGLILTGPLQGQSLDMLTRPACLDLYATCLRDDPEGARLLEAYLDRRFAGWREAAEAQADPGGARPSSSAMSEKDAYETLGLPQGAGADEIIRAHRALMKKLHPDHGGATSLAARVNQAKDVLLRRH